MNCVVCDERAGYNRAVIDRSSERHVGGLCMNCEREVLGDRLETAAGEPSGRCLCCDRAGRFSFPRYLPAPEPLGNDVIVRSTLEDVAVAATLCGDHTRALSANVRLRSRVRR